MALLTCHFYSEVLGMNTSMLVILPQRRVFGSQEKASKQEDKVFPTLYLLHGFSDDHTIWLRRTSIERYVEQLNLAVVIPQVHRSYYTDMTYGYRYWTFISEELPRICHSFFPLSNAREDTFVAGLSMGGYGAFKLALRYPERFAAAASLSGALDIASSSHIGLRQLRPDDYVLIYGEQNINGTEHDLLWLLEQTERIDIPKTALFQCCGTEDFLYDANVRFRDACQRTSISLTYEEETGDHNWAYWDQKIQDVLKWLPIRENQ